MTTVTLIGRDGCHLCDDAREVVTRVIAQVPQVILEERSLDDDPDLHDLYWEQIPVVLINGKVHNYWRIDPDRLLGKLKEEQ